MIKTRYLVGIDEAGRGPLAGPVSVGAVMIKLPMTAAVHKVLSQGKDSKQLSEKQRESIYWVIEEAQQAGYLEYACTFSSAELIDNKGITYAIKKALATNLKKLNAHPKNTKILLDGSLKAPEQFMDQETIIKGDAKIPLIGLASIVAKVTRDRHMKKLGKKYPKYKFQIHKGYGTVFHRSMIKKHGTCIEHRLTWVV